MVALIAASAASLYGQAPKPAGKSGLPATDVTAVAEACGSLTDYGAKNMLLKLSKAGAAVKAETVYSNRNLDNHRLIEYSAAKCHGDPVTQRSGPGGRR